MRWAVTALAIGAALSVAAGGCTAARNTLGTSASQCFRALPAANDAVHDRGQLVGVRYLKAGSLDKEARHSRRLREMIASTHGRPACIVAFAGSYPRGSVKGSITRRSGRYAVLVLDASSGALQFAIVVDRLPLRPPG